MNQMGRSQIGYRNDAVPWYYGWSPGGFGCSGDCGGCWAKAMADRGMSVCPKCKAFEVHLHEERLKLPACTSPGGVVLVNFTCDTFDKERPDIDVVRMIQAIAAAPHHNYVFLTKNPEGMACWDFRSADQQSPHKPEFCKFPPNVFLGLSICNQSQADEKLPIFVEIHGHKWLSLEPLWERVYVSKYLPHIDGVIVGHDNRRSAPGTDTLDNIESIMVQCFDAGVPCYIKQAFLRYNESGQEITSLPGLWNCDTDKFKLVKDAKELSLALAFNHDIRELPWSMPEVKR